MLDSNCTLNEMGVGDTALAIKIAETDLGMRLMDIGIIPGSQLRVLFSGARGGPIGVLVDDTFMVGLRLSEAELVSVYSSTHHDDPRH